MLHIAWTYNAHGGQMAIYVNGQIDASAVGRPNTTKDADVLIGFSEALAGGDVLTSNGAQRFFRVAQ